MLDLQQMLGDFTDKLKGKGNAISDAKIYVAKDGYLEEIRRIEVHENNVFGKLEDMSEIELEAKMKQILDDYAPILNVTPTVKKLKNNKGKESKSPSKSKENSKD